MIINLAIDTSDEVKQYYMKCYPTNITKHRNHIEVKMNYLLPGNFYLIIASKIGKKSFHIDPQFDNIEKNERNLSFDLSEYDLQEKDTGLITFYPNEQNAKILFDTFNVISSDDEFSLGKSSFDLEKHVIYSNDEVITHD